MATSAKVISTASRKRALYNIGSPRYPRRGDYHRGRALLPEPTGTVEAKPEPRAGLEVALLFALWCALANLICLAKVSVKGHYAAIIGLILLIFAARPLAALIRSWSALARARHLAARLMAGCVVVFGWFHLYSFADQITAPRNLNRLVDIGENTYAAGKLFFAGGVNPYTYRAQIWYDLAGAHGVTIDHGETYLFGVRYKYGYVYFPWMFASYEPFRQLIGTFNAIRLGNLVWVIINILGMGLLAQRLARRPDRSLAALAMIAAFLSAKRAGYDLYSLGVTDILISWYLLFGFLAVEREKDILAGLCFGLAQASKLLPAALFSGVTFLWYPTHRRRFRFLLAFIAVVAVIMGPFILADPQAFFSASILYYLTFHAEGDGTAYYGTLPRPRRMPFQLGHLAAIIMVMFVGFRRRQHRDVKRLILVSTVGYLIFLAGNKMFHMNYFWSILGPACTTFVLQLLPARPAGSEAASA